jgi:L-lactate dehydrogenase complex protein LldG
VAAFVAAATGVGAEVVGRPDEDLSSIVRRVLDDIRPSRVAITNDPECQGVASLFEAGSVDVVSGGDPAVVATADVGITGAIAGIALTGSVVVESGRSRSRLISVLPDVHLALLRADRIFPTPGSLLRDPSSVFSGGLPSNVVLITGPSRSADIELVITIGVHGPRRVLIALR